MQGWPERRGGCWFKLGFVDIQNRAEIEKYLALLQSSLEVGIAALENAQREMADAVAAERERCGRIADKWAKRAELIREPSAIGVAQHIAAEIRSGSGES